MNISINKRRDLYYGFDWITAILALLVMAIFVATADPAKAQSVNEQIVGIYTLARYSAHGDEPTGRISYDSTGHMWVMLLPPGRDPLTGSSTPEEYRNAMRGVVAYYGTYKINESMGRIIHHVEAASNPAWIGNYFVRWFRFDGPNLLISLDAGFTDPLLWERLPDHSSIDRPVK